MSDLPPFNHELYEELRNVISEAIFLHFLDPKTNKGRLQTTEAYKAALAYAASMVAAAPKPFSRAEIRRISKDAAKELEQMVHDSQKEWAQIKKEGRAKWEGDHWAFPKSH